MQNMKICKNIYVEEELLGKRIKSFNKELKGLHWTLDTG